MRAIEILVFAEDQTMLKDLLTPLDAQESVVFDIPAHRFSVTPDLSMLAYPFLFDLQPPEEWLSAVKPFLSGIILLMRKDSITSKAAVCQTLDELMKFCADIPAIVALDSDVMPANPVAHTFGYTLQQQSELLFWDRSREVTGDIWQALVSLIPAVAPAESNL